MHTGWEDFWINSENILDKSSMFWIVALEILLTCKTDVKLAKDAKFCTMKLSSENLQYPKKITKLFGKTKSHERKESKLLVDDHRECETYIWAYRPGSFKERVPRSFILCSDSMPLECLTLKYLADTYLKSKAEFFGWMGRKPLLWELWLQCAHRIFAKKEGRNRKYRTWQNF